jgi:phytol kinase
MADVLPPPLPLDVPGAAFLAALSADAAALAASFGFAGALLAIAEGARRGLRVPQDLTRKFVHIGAGCWVFAVLALFKAKAAGLLPFAAFVPANALLWRLRVLPSVDAPDASLGTVWFAATITTLFAALWHPPAPAAAHSAGGGDAPDLSAVAAAAVMAMTFGDALAALLGVRCGRTRYRLLRAASVRSVEGSAAMLLASWAAMAATLAALPLGGGAAAAAAAPLSLGTAAAVAAPAALLATLVEAASPWGLDNVVVPAVAAGALLATLTATGALPPGWLAAHVREAAAAPARRLLGWG